MGDPRRFPGLDGTACRDDGKPLAYLPALGVWVVVDRTGARADGEAVLVTVLPAEARCGGVRLAGVTPDVLDLVLASRVPDRDRPARAGRRAPRRRMRP